MGRFEFFMISFGLSMDAFAVSVCKGLSVYKLNKKYYLIIGAWFGGFQALMPLIGYCLGSAFEKYITSIDHWITFILLSFIGVKMLREGISNQNDDINGSFSIKTMAILAIATSVDALAVGITFALLPSVNILAAVSFVGMITFALSMLGLKIGNAFGIKYRSKAEIAGGVILIIIGLKIFLEHMGII